MLLQRRRCSASTRASWTDRGTACRGSSSGTPAGACSQSSLQGNATHIDLTDAYLFCSCSVVVQVLCSYSTLPLYAIVSHVSRPFLIEDSRTTRLMHKSFYFLMMEAYCTARFVVLILLLFVDCVCYSIRWGVRSRARCSPTTSPTISGAGPTARGGA